jgi:hypothetical protein
MKKLGKHKTGRSCLYIKKLEDVDLPTLNQLIKQSLAGMEKWQNDDATVPRRHSPPVYDAYGR